ncbi:hypothetical protein HWV62_33401 [Athelia sp. TMB]|nr:hypothetical protein HWV62_33401 [Athelia sp. TMB]
MVKIPSGEVLQLPVPGQSLGANNMIATEEFAINSKCTVPVLQGRLRAYGLPVSGTKPMLIQSLKTFANDPSAWSQMFQSHKSKTRGAITGARLKKGSSRQIIAQFGDQPVQTEYPSNKSVDRKPQKLDEQRIVQNDSWAMDVLARSKPQHGESASAGSSAINNASSSSDLSLEPGNSQMDVDEREHEIALTGIRLRKIERHMSSFTELSTRFARLEDVLVKAANGAQTPFLQSEPQFKHAPYTRSATSISTPAASITPVPPMSLTHGRSIPASEISPQNLVVLTLGDEELAVDRTMVPDPPSIVFSHDLSALFAAWHCSDALVVNGRGIPIKYWPLFYHAKNGIKGGAWKALRTIWGNWKFVVEERERFESDNAFWDAYSANDSHLDYTTILKRLADNRASQAQQDVHDVMLFFNGDLSHPNANGAFTYTSGKTTKVLTKAGDISKKWRALLGSNTLIAHAWDLRREAKLNQRTAPAN